MQVLRIIIHYTDDILIISKSKDEDRTVKCMVTI